MTIEEKTYERILRKREALDKLRPFNQGALHKLQETFRVEMTYNSNAIEGNSLSYESTKDVLEGKRPKGKYKKRSPDTVRHRNRGHENK